MIRYKGFSLKKDGPVVGMEKAPVEKPEFPTLKMAPEAITVYPCFCASGELSKWLRGRAHYQFGVNGFPFVTDRETRLRNHRLLRSGKKSEACPCFSPTDGKRRGYGNSALPLRRLIPIFPDALSRKAARSRRAPGDGVGRI